MDKVADYINEMQKIHDLYSPLFNKLMNQSQHEKVKVIYLHISVLYQETIMHEPVTTVWYLHESTT